MDSSFGICIVCNINIIIYTNLLTFWHTPSWPLSVESVCQLVLWNLFFLVLNESRRVPCNYDEPSFCVVYSASQLSHSLYSLAALSAPPPWPSSHLSSPARPTQSPAAWLRLRCHCQMFPYQRQTFCLLKLPRLVPFTTACTVGQFIRQVTCLLYCDVILYSILSLFCN